MMTTSTAPSRRWCPASTAPGTPGPPRPRHRAPGSGCAGSACRRKVRGARRARTGRAPSRARTAERQIAHPHHDEARDQQQAIRGVREAVVQQLDPTKHVRLVLGLARGTGEPHAVRGVEAHGDDREQHVEELDERVRRERDHGTTSSVPAGASVAAIPVERGRGMNGLPAPRRDEVPEEPDLLGSRRSRR